MATDADVKDVRQNTDEPGQATWTDDDIKALVDANGINGASAIIWRKKAATYTDLVDVSEAGSSHAFGELQDKAIKQAEFYEQRSGATASGPRVSVIDRS